MLMKKIFYSFFVVIGFLGISSCSQDENEILNVDNHLPLQTRSLGSEDSLSIITPLIVDSNLIAKKRARVASTYYNESDPYFSSNMYAIREMPVTIKARGNGKYLTYNGLGKEVTLSDSQSRFYLKVLPASSGIPYLIYSYNTDTPLSVGQYDSNPSNKVLYVRNDNSGSLMSADWDLIPSSSYKGYFAIESQSYLGQSDPNNMWSVFNYALETKSTEKLGYGQYKKQASQEFLIKPTSQFKLIYLEFYKEGSSTVKQSPLKVTTYSKNESEERRSFVIPGLYYADDESRFYESSLLNVSISNSTDKFYRPIVEAEKIVPPQPVAPDEDPAPVRPETDMVYSTSNQKIKNKLVFTINGVAKPRSLIEVTSYLENYSVSVPYTAYMTYTYNNEERLVKIRGTWYGKIYTSERDDDYPKDIVKCFDLDSGDEILRLKSMQLSPITFK